MHSEIILMKITPQISCFVKVFIAIALYILVV